MYCLRSEEGEKGEIRVIERIDECGHHPFGRWNGGKSGLGGEGLFEVLSTFYGVGPSTESRSVYEMCACSCNIKSPKDYYVLLPHQAGLINQQYCFWDKYLGEGTRYD